MVIGCLLIIIPFGFYETIAFAVVSSGLQAIHGYVQVAQLQLPYCSSGDRALGLPLTDNIAVEFGDDFAGRQIRHEVKGFQGSD